MHRTLEIVVDSMSAAVTRCSRDLRYVWASKPYAAWLGLPLDRIVDRPIVEVVGERAFARLLPYFESVLRGESVRYETEVDFQGIGPRWIEGRYTPTFDARGVDGWVAVIVDLSERKRAERERDEMLRREQAAREVAEAATRQRDTLFSMISHELRNPLTPILTWAEILRDGAISEEQRLQAIETIERCVGSQTKLIEDLFDVARIAAGKMRLDVQRTDLCGVILRVLDVMRPDADAKGVELSLHVEPGARHVPVDAERFQQVVWNLLSNAIKHTPRGGLVALELTGTDAFVELTVRDTGAGIDPAFLPRIFDAFAQAAPGAGPRADASARAGLGLGLAIVRNLVEAHGGSVRVESKGPGLGATFVVRLPRVPPQIRA